MARNWGRLGPCIQRLYSNFDGALQRRAPKRQGNPRSVRLRLEELEGRTLPTIVFTPHFLNEQAHPSNGVLSTPPPVEVIFWGSQWANSTPSQETILGEVQTILSSTYLTATERSYGTAASATFARAVNAPANVADPASGFSEGTLEDVVSNTIHAGLLPEPDGPISPIYVVI